MPTVKEISVRFNVSSKELNQAQKELKTGAQLLEKEYQRLADTNGKLSKTNRDVYRAYERTLRLQGRTTRVTEQYAREVRDLRKAHAGGAITADMYEQRLKEIGVTMARNQVILQRAVATGRRAGSAAAGVGIIDQLIGHKDPRGFIDVLNDISFKLLVITFAAQQAGEMLLRIFVQAGEKVELLRTRITAFAGDVGVFDELFQSAQDLGVEFESFAGSFNRFAVVNEEIGLTNDQLVEMTETIAAMGVISGGTVQEINAGLQQLAQGFASTNLQGDELRSVMENIPFLAVTLAEQLGTTVGGLRKMGEEGELASERIAKAVLDAAPEIKRAMELIPDTTERALTRVSNAWGNMVNAALRAVGSGGIVEAINDIARALQDLADYIDANRATVRQFLHTVMEVGKVLATVFAGQIFIKFVLGGIRTYTAAATAAGVATMGLARGLAALALGPVGLAIAFIGAALWEWHAAAEATNKSINDTLESMETFEQRRGRLEVETNIKAIEEENRAIEDQISSLEQGIRLRQQGREKVPLTAGPFVGELQGLPVTTGAEAAAAEIEELQSAIDVLTEKYDANVSAINKAREELLKKTEAAKLSAQATKTQEEALEDAGKAMDTFRGKVDSLNQSYRQTVQGFDDFANKLRGIEKTTYDYRIAAAERLTEARQLLKIDPAQAVQAAKDAQALVEKAIEANEGQVTGQLKQLGLKIADVGKVAAAEARDQGIIDAAKELGKVEEIKAEIEAMFAKDYELRIKVGYAGQAAVFGALERQGAGSNQIRYPMGIDPDSGVPMFSDIGTRVGTQPITRVGSTFYDPTEMDNRGMITSEQAAKVEVTPVLRPGSEQDLQNQVEALNIEVPVAPSVDGSPSISEFSEQNLIFGLSRSQGGQTYGPLVRR